MAGVTVRGVLDEVQRLKKGRWYMSSSDKMDSCTLNVKDLPIGFLYRADVVSFQMAKQI